MKIRYRCCECGNVFDEDEILEVQESRGEFWGFPCSETCSYSPCCEADYEEFVEDEEEDEEND